MSELNKILICGNGLAANLTALALQESLPQSIQIDLVRTSNQQDEDIFYGNVTSPDIYDFHLQLNVSEPDVILNTDSSFSYGSYFDHWGMTDNSWMQCFHLALPVEKGVSFHHFISRQKQDLQHYLISARAALKGKFAHPPEDPKNPLSRAEFGYQFSPSSLSKLYSSKLNISRVKIHQSPLDTVEVADNKIVAVTLKSGEEVQAPLYIDCTGPNAQLLSVIAPNNTQKKSRRLGAIKSVINTGQLGPAFRRIQSFPFGWQSETPLQGGIERLTVFDTTQENQEIKDHGSNELIRCEITTGARDKAWLANCIAIGQSASVFEPLTPAPSKLLVSDVKRLLELIPVTTDMQLEATEYNRRFNDDVEHTSLFYGALYSFPELPSSNYWQQANKITRSDKLSRKLQQFEHRGVLVTYDLEPFNEQDWTILHYGMKRTPQTYDLLAQQMSVREMSHAFNQMQSMIEQITNKMPQHALYMDKLQSFLKKNH